jgi:ariadne-1
MIVNTKNCPNCKKPIEKNQGCNHMTCHKSFGGCGNEFCWICMAEWKKHGDSYYKCNFYDEKIPHKENEKVKNIKTELQKYSFYFDRFINHKKTRDFLTKMAPSIKASQEKLINEHNANFIDTQFLCEGYNTIHKGLRVLMNTYVFGYYLKDDCALKKLFEYNQYLLERSVDFIVEKLEDNKQLGEIFKIEEFDEFNAELSSYRDVIKNKAVLTNNYIDNIIKDIEEKMIDELKNLKHLD